MSSYFECPDFMPLGVKSDDAERVRIGKDLYFYSSLYYINLNTSLYITVKPVLCDLPRKH
jgi:hypothetical protein